MHILILEPKSDENLSFLIEEAQEVDVLNKVYIQELY